MHIKRLAQHRTVRRSLPRAIASRDSALLVSVATVLAGGSQISFAQTFFGDEAFEWQVSGDSGASWQGGDLEVPLSQQRSHVRAVASWSADAGFAFGLVRFDATIATDAPVGDGAMEFSRGVAFSTGWVQTIVATRFGSVLKIDDSRDVLPPGEGSHGVTPSQLSPQFGHILDSSNPAVIFAFTLMLDGSAGRRTIDALFLIPPGHEQDRYMGNYPFAAGGTFNFPRMSYSGASVTVVPGPWSAAMMAGAFAAGLRRRRTPAA